MEAEINRWLKEACVDNGYAHMAHVITWRFSNRLKSTLGQARCLYGKYEIELSSYLWATIGEEEKMDTVKHEACHILAFYKYGKKAWGHGPLWKECMENAGVSPRRCHKVTRPTSTRRNEVFCSCMSYFVSNLVLQRIQNGRAYHCKHCKGGLYTTKEARDAQLKVAKNIQVMGEKLLESIK